MASAVAIAALDVLVDEELSERAARLGEIMRDGLRKVMKRSNGTMTEVRGMGLLNAVVIAKNERGRGAWELCLLLKEKGREDYVQRETYQLICFARSTCKANT